MAPKNGSIYPTIPEPHQAYYLPGSILPNGDRIGTDGLPIGVDGIDDTAERDAGLLFNRNPIPTDSTAFTTTYLVYETVRTPFTERLYGHISKETRKKLNILAAIVQAAILVLPTIVYLASAEVDEHACTFVTNPMKKVAVWDYSKKSWDYIRGYKPESSYEVDEGSIRTLQICEQIIDASLERRESLLRNYLGPFAVRRGDTKKQFQCGYIEKPDVLATGEQQGIVPYNQLYEYGYYYGAAPLLQSTRNKDKTKNPIKVCIMEPVHITVLGTDAFMKWVSVLGIGLFVFMYLFGPKMYHDKFFTISIIGMVMVSGVAVSMVAVFTTAIYVSTMRWAVSKVVPKPDYVEMKNANGEA